MVALAAAAVLMALAWLRAGGGPPAVAPAGAGPRAGELQAELAAALVTVLPHLAAAERETDAHDWLPPAATAGAAVHCRVVAADSDLAWWQIQQRVAAAVQAAGGRVLWGERLPRGRRAQDLRAPNEARDLLRLDIGADGAPTHTLLLYRQGTPRPQVHWDQDLEASAWRRLRALAGGPVVALVIDDWGYRQDAATSGLLALDVPLTLAVLPGLSFSRRFALESTDLALPDDGHPVADGPCGSAAALRRAAGCPVSLSLESALAQLAPRRREIILHLPMEPRGYPDVDPGPRALLVGMSRQQIGALLDDCLRSLPGLRGVSNHMGSAATADGPTMEALMAELAVRSLVFLDSLTGADSVAYQTALAAGLPAARNRIFLDHGPQESALIRDRLRALVNSARAAGFAVGIGHPHPATMQVLQEEVPRWRAEGVLFVTLSELLALQAAAAAGPEA